MGSGHIFIVTAPSGAGKTTLVAALLSSVPTIKLSISHTTRLPREGEVDGRHYHFVSTACFESGIKNGDFLEYARVYNYYYGTSTVWLREQIEQGLDVLLEIDWQGAKQVKEIFPDSISIFILPPSLEELEKRLRGRGTDKNEIIAYRLSKAQDEISHAVHFDYMIINDDLGKATVDLVSIIRAERLRMRRQQRFLNKFLSSNTLNNL